MLLGIILVNADIHILTIFWQSSDILYYEVLDIPLPELQGLKTLKLVFHHFIKDEVRLHFTIHMYIFKYSFETF